MVQHPSDWSSPIIKEMSANTVLFLRPSRTIVYIGFLMFIPALLQSTISTPISLQTYSTFTHLFFILIYFGLKTLKNLPQKLQMSVAPRHARGRPRCAAGSWPGTGTLTTSHGQHLGLSWNLRSRMWVKQCHKPSMTGNGKHTTYKMVILGMVCDIVLPIL